MESKKKEPRYEALKGLCDIMPMPVQTYSRDGFANGLAALFGYLQMQIS